jgi:collagen type I/II/III/V/XI/XXIV/XXVII alpha
MTTFTWTSTASGDWNTASNWSPATIPNSSTADVEVNTPGSYTITIAAAASDTIDSLDMQSGAGGLEVDGTLAFAAGSAGAITGALQSLVTLNNGTIVNAGTINPNFVANGSVAFTGTNAIYFNNGLTANAGATAIVNSTSGLAEVSGHTLFDGVFSANTGTIELGGTGGASFNLQTIEGPPLNSSGYTAAFLVGSGTVEEFNGTAYVPIESTVTDIAARGTIFALSRNYTTSNSLTIGGEFFESDGVMSTGGAITVQSGGTLAGSSAQVSSPIVDNGTIQVLTGDLLLSGSISGTGVLTYDPTTGGTLEIGGTTGNAVQMFGTDTLKLDQPSSFSGTVTATTTDTIILQGITATNAVLNGSTLVVNNGSTEVYSMQVAGVSGDSFNVSNGNTISIVCFAHGTRIRTPDGDVPVEQLAVGQNVVTASGKTAPIIWIGRRRIDCRRHPEPWQVWPVLISAGAFGKGLPQRDLLVSPQHGIYDNGVLVPARFLINDTTIVQEPVAQVEYFHVELETHDLLLAEGLPAESYLENGDRNSFDNGGGVLVLHPDFSRWSWDARACAELKITGPELEAIHAKLERRAAQLAAASKRRRRAAKSAAA